MSGAESVLALRVQAIRHQAEGIRSYELRDPSGAVLPEFTAGAHVDFHLAPGLVRSYSLSNDPAERHRYVVGVQRDEASRGGSAHVHEQLRVGDVIDVSAPRNHFELTKDPGPSVLVAGGIGITPLLAMARSLAADGQAWELHYAARDRGRLAFLEDLRHLEAAAGGTGRVLLHVDAEEGRPLDLAAIVKAAPEDAQLYCCGPEPMLKAFDAATAHLTEERRHIEHFANSEAAATDGGYEVQLAVSGMVVQVTAGQTMLDAVRAVGVDVDYSCMEGVCGTCEVRVLRGEPDHRDQVLTDREKASNEVVMICCSGSLGPRLVLDL